VFFIIQDLWATCVCPEKQSCPAFFTALKYFLSFRIFEQHALALKTKFPLKYFTVLKYFSSFKDFWATCAYPENRVYHDIFHCIRICFSLTILMQLALALKAKFALKIFKPPCLVRLWFQVLVNYAKFPSYHCSHQKVCFLISINQMIKEMNFLWISEGYKYKNECGRRCSNCMSVSSIFLEDFQGVLNALLRICVWNTQLFQL